MPFGNVLRPTLYRDAAQGVNTQSEADLRHRSSRSATRRIYGYHNAACDELADIPERPPAYTQATQSQLSVPPPSESLPGYSCSVSCQGVVEMKMERTSPFDVVQHGMWMETFARLRGTLFELCHVKMPGGFFGTSAKHAGLEPGAGRSIRRYTLQHAEVGVASDHKKVELVPRSQLATILPDSVLERLKQTEPHLFDEVHHYVARLRLEGDQLLLRFKSSEDRANWMSQLCAAVDIAPPLDVRSEPRYHTLPRRRRRDHGRSRRTRDNLEIQSAELAQQQERIARSHYPNLIPESEQNLQTASHSSHPSPALTNDDAGYEQEISADRVISNSDPEADDLDGEFMDRELPRRVDNITEESVEQHLRARPGISHDFHLDTIPTSRTDSKQALHMPHDAAREARYRRRCMPILVYNSKHANDIIVRKGKPMKIDWEKKSLRPYLYQLPSYEASCTGNREAPLAFLKALPFGKPKLNVDREVSSTAPEAVAAGESLSASSTTENADGSCDEEAMPQRKGSWTSRIRKVASRRDLTTVGIPSSTLDENEILLERVVSPQNEEGARIYNATNIDDGVLIRLGF